MFDNLKTMQVVSNPRAPAAVSAKAPAIPLRSIAQDETVTQVASLSTNARLNTPRLSLPLLLAGWAAMLAALSAHPVLEDEALYAAWALELTQHDFWLIGAPVDKPPLFLWLLAAWQQLIGASIPAMRLLNVMLSLLDAALLYALARRLLGRSTAWLTLAVYAASPFVILFAPTLFTDPLLVATLLAASLAALHRRWGWLGFSLGLSLATKQQALLLIPAPLLLASRPPTHKRLAIWRGLIGFLLALGPALAWDAYRLSQTPAGGPPAVWVQSAVSYGGLTLTPIADWLPRLADWLALIRFLAPGWAPAGLLLLGIILAFSSRPRSFQSNRAAPRPAAQTMPLLAFVLIYLALHIVVSFQVWDRYLLPLAPLLALFSALALRWLWQRSGPVILLIALLLLVPPAWQAAHGGFPIGSDHGAYDGIEEASQVVRRTLPDNAQGVLYHHWLGWHWQYYLADTHFQRIYYPTAAFLAADAAGPAQYTRLIVIPAWRQDDALVPALAAQGLRLHWLHTTHRPDGSPSFLIYRIQPSP